MTPCPVLVVDPDTALAPMICDLVGVPVCAVWPEAGIEAVLDEIEQRQSVVVVTGPGHARLRARIDVPVIVVASRADAATAALEIRKLLTARARQALVER